MRGVAQRFEVFLRRKGLRLTRQRSEILRAIYATHRHVTVEELTRLLKAQRGAEGPRIARATVYRTLSLLVEGGFVDALEVGRDQGLLYEHTLGHDHHDHMICLQCGRIIEFSDAELERVQARVVRRHGFRPASHRLNVYGVCERCADPSRPVQQAAT